MAGFWAQKSAHRYPAGHGHPERETQYVEAPLRPIVKLEQSWNLFQVRSNFVEPTSSGRWNKAGTSSNFVPHQLPATRVDQQNSHGRHSSPVQSRGVRTGNRRPSKAKAAHFLSPDSMPAPPEPWGGDLPSRAVQLRSGTEEMGQDSPISY